MSNGFDTTALSEPYRARGCFLHLEQSHRVRDEPERVVATTFDQWLRTRREARSAVDATVKDGSSGEFATVGNARERTGAFRGNSLPLVAFRAELVVSLSPILILGSIVS